MFTATLKLETSFYWIVATGGFVLTWVVGRPPVVASCFSIRKRGGSRMKLTDEASLCQSS